MLLGKGPEFPAGLNSETTRPGVALSTSTQGVYCFQRKVVKHIRTGTGLFKEDGVWEMVARMEEMEDHVVGWRHLWDSKTSFCQTC